MTKHQNSSRRISDSLSRRDVLRAGGLLLPAAAVTPALFTRVSRAATSSSTFDYYISTSGNDSNSGSLSSPWAITGINTHQSTYAGKRLGILPGTYDVSALMAQSTNNGYQEAILQINGGPNSSTRTYVGTSDSSGNYQRGTATLDAKGASGIYGGSLNETSPAYVIGQTQGSPYAPQPPNLGNWTLDGLNITGFSRWAITLADSGGVPTGIQNVTIQNCTLHDSVSIEGPITTHPAPLMIYCSTNVLVSNCWFYNNKNIVADKNHYAGIMIFAPGGGSAAVTNVTIEKCTLANSSNIYAGEDLGPVSNITIRQCYIDMTLAGTNFAQPYALQGFGRATAGLTASSFYNNIVKGGNFYDMSGTAPSSVGIKFYNNTWDRAGGAGYSSSDAGLFRFEETAGNTHMFTAYNNLVYDNGAGSYGGYGMVACNTDGFALCDYNIYGATSGFYTYGANGGGGTGSVSFASWKSAIGGDAHSSQNSTNPFTNNGANALQYQISPGSPAYQAGRVGGVASGAVCNVGAWDGTVTQIGYSSSSSGAIAVPQPPVLSIT